MPNYQYQCQECGELFTDRKPLSERRNCPRCPACDSEDTKRKIGGSNISCGSSSSPG